MRRIGREGAGLGGFEDISSVLLPVGVVLVITSFLMILRKSRKTKQGPNLEARAHMEKLRQQAPMRSDMEALKVEIEQLTRRMSSMLDNKAARIEALLDEADRTIVRLEQAQNLDPSRSDQLSRDRQAVEGVVAQQEVAEDLPAPDAALPQLPQDDLSDRINALADQGMPSEVIARELDEYIGKVELILSLRRA